MQKTECHSRQEQRKIRNHDIMSAREPESCLQISGERRMTIAAIAAASSKATNRDIMSAKEKEAAT